jgi:hypothetical protein
LDPTLAASQARRARILRFARRGGEAVDALPFFSFDAIAESCKPLLATAIIPSFRNLFSSDH